ncbi:hypothetical protein DL240_00100 [Lujinxingia litoralis]|uniref:Uncharacterized protein n=1 Tax=Lujinxingia litoralis TaxID=2211119 RepID=A0A328CAJ5_9DELT|nr:hypothetical protein [Lujinxingia litoralis]RAL24646.1 hypothetical protein DL240_00100 [Lujinxingia litoralis]
MKLSLFAPIALCLTLAGVPTFAQSPPESDTSYAPQMVPEHQLLVTSGFSRSPLSFPWDLLSSREVAREGRVDFEHVYDIPFSQVRTEVESTYLGRKDFAGVTPEAVPHSDVGHLRIIGMELGQTRARLRLGHPDIAPQFSVELEADGRQTRVLIENTTSNPFYSGFTPARAPFEPAGAAPIPFRWN